jgi:SAM-dependent methyltransferase
MRSDLDVYDDLLRHQAEASFGLEQVLFTSAAWHAAATVLDVGCGNGFYTRLLAQKNPDKHFIALEPDEKLHTIAKEHNHMPNLEVVRGTVNDLPNDFEVDVFFSRLVLMYIENITEIAVWAHKHAKASIIVDPADDLFVIKPSLTPYTSILDKNAARIKSLGGRRNMDEVTRTSWRKAGHVEHSQQDIIISTEITSTGAMLQLMLLNAEMIAGTPLDADVYKTTYEWSLKTDAYLQYALRGKIFMSSKQS